MADVPWLEAAICRAIDPRLRIMRPSEIDYGLLEAPVRDLVRALNASGVVETLGSCGGHPFEETEPRTRRADSARVNLHVLDESCWRDLALAIAHAIRAVPALTVAVTFDHEAVLQLLAPAWLPADARRRLLDAGLDRAALAVLIWYARAEGLAGD